MLAADVVFFPLRIPQIVFHYDSKQRVCIRTCRKNSQDAIYGAEEKKRAEVVRPDKSVCNCGQSRGYSEGILGTIAQLIGSPERKMN